jgi:hypothetical protein
MDIGRCEIIIGEKEKDKPRNKSIHHGERS